MSSNPLELVVFDPSAATSGSFSVTLAGGLGTLVVYNDSAYTLKFADANGNFLRRVLAGTVDKIVLCDHPVYTVQWKRATDASGNTVVLSNYYQALMSLCQVDGYQSDVQLDQVFPFAIPRLTTQATGTAPPTSGAIVYGAYSGLNYQLLGMDYTTPVLIDMFDYVTSSTTTISGSTPYYGPNWTESGTLTCVAPDASSPKQAQISGGVMNSPIAQSFAAAAEVLVCGFRYSGNSLGATTVTIDAAGSYGVTVTGNNGGQPIITITLPGITVYTLTVPIVAASAWLVRLKWSNATWQYAASVNAGSLALPALPSYSAPATGSLLTSSKITVSPPISVYGSIGGCRPVSGASYLNPVIQVYTP